MLSPDGLFLREAVRQIFPTGIGLFTGSLQADPIHTWTAYVN
jgi:hypothetical protein